MNPANPFDSVESDKTIIKPRLGKAPAKPEEHREPKDVNFFEARFEAQSLSFKSFPESATASNPASPEKLWATIAHASEDWIEGANPNALLASAKPLIRYARLLKEHSFDAEAMSRFLTLQLGKFEQRAQQAACDKVETEAAKYVLCTVLDEFAGDSIWGGSGVWARHSMLLIHFRETWGGEKVFQLLERFQRDPKRFIQSLELIYCCMGVGFKGKFHIQHEGDLAHQALKSQLFKQIRLQRGNTPEALADDWTSKAPKHRTRLRVIPWWLAPVGTVCLLSLLYMGVLFHLHGIAQDSANVIANIRPTPPNFGSIAEVKSDMSLSIRLRDLLSDEIARSAVSLDQRGVNTVLTVGGDGMFDSGQVTLKPQILALMNRVVQSLQQVEVTVLVQGHTDGQAIRSLRFPSNWELSEARAEAVSNYFQSRGLRHAIRKEGLGESQPVANNATPEGRALNRRVEIQLTPLNNQVL
ncbi:MAG: type IVB secretion system protein IcmH/DotU [Limnobacter sp.]|nr:type IVB secretion system protein IcmH/DotU [Limnobacter sp.]